MRIILQLVIIIARFTFLYNTPSHIVPTPQILEHKVRLPSLASPESVVMMMSSISADEAMAQQDMVGDDEDEVAGEEDSYGKDVGSQLFFYHVHLK